MSHELILGIDGGGSKVLVTLADKDGRILRTALGGGVNPMWLRSRAPAKRRKRSLRPRLAVLPARSLRPSRSNPKARLPGIATS